MFFLLSNIRFQAWSLLLVLLCLPTLCGAGTLDVPAPAAAVRAGLWNGELPAELGEVVFRKNADSPVQIFIVANSHRSCSTGRNGSRTVQAQLETFRIGA